MEQICIRHSELPGATRLFADFLYHFDRVEPFYAHAPYDPESFVRAAAEVRYPEERRAAMAAALGRLNPGNPSVERFAKAGTVAVVSGQQVGLFGGPLYTIFKALAAARLAADLTARGIEAVPVFWLATEDHDLEEVNQSWAFDRAHTPVSLRSGAADPQAGPVGPVALRDLPLAELEKTLAGMDFADEAMALLRECYRDGVSFGAAFRALMQKLLGPYGVLLLDPMEAGFREVAGPLLREAWERDGELLEAVMERNGELEAAGYHAQVHAEKGSTLLFVLRNGRRTAWNKIAKSAVADVTGMVRENPAMLSPNALLRPVVQDYMLPTVAYLGGPAELAYFAQSEVLYRRLLGRMPVMMHRASFTLVDTRAGKVMDHYRLGLKDVLTPAVSLRELMASRLVPAGLVEQFGAARERVEVELARLSHAVLDFDPGLAKGVAKAKAKIGYQMGKLERKTAREAMRRDERAGADADYLYNALYPRRHMQERLYGLAPFLAQHGPGLVERVYEHVRPECPDHQLLRID